jgi:ribosome modulation factor
MTTRRREAPRIARERKYRVLLKPADPSDSCKMARSRGLRAGEAQYLAAACPYTARDKRTAWLKAWVQGLARVNVSPPPEVRPMLARLGLYP